jgi:hypothetical protein
MKKLMNISRKLHRERGSALLVSLMVMVGLSLLGLGFVAITETESAIAINERNSAQAMFAAETGARAVVDFFQDSSWAKDRGLLPPNVLDFKTRRVFPHDTSMTSYYKSNVLVDLFDKPFKGNNYQDKFYGDGDRNPPTADIWIYYGKNTASDDYLDLLNAALFVPDTVHRESVRISDIRVYAPPIPGDTQNVNGFWMETQPRYGVATVRVTAQKMVGDNVVAERVVKTVVAETPFPTVDGAIETSGTLVGQGSFEVYWGKVLSEKDIELKRAVAGLPWFDAKHQMQFEYGFDSAGPRLPSTPYVAGNRVMAPATALSADPELRKFSYKASVPGTSADVATSPADGDWPKNIGDPLNDGGVTWITDYAVSFPKDAEFYHREDWFYQLIGQNIPDPWLHARARLGIIAPNQPPCGLATTYHPCDYNDVGDDVQTHFSNLFQFQTTTEGDPEPQRIEAVFPTMDYEFWKNVALSGNNENGVYYFKYATPITGDHNEFIGPGGLRKHVIYWLNALSNGRGAGFYFFDTKNAKNPQFGKGGILTPQIELNSGSIGTYTTGSFQMQGYIYLNAAWFGTSGLGNKAPTDYYPMPGEPFRDVGFREADDSGTGPTYPFRIDGGALPTGDYVWAGVNNGVWDFQDVNKNGKFDLYLDGPVDRQRPNGDPVTAVYVPVPFYNGCNPGANGAAGANCSEPHEPYLNMTYTAAFSGLNPETGVTVEWYDPTLTAASDIQQYRKPKRRTGMNTTVTCLSGSSLDDCTSNSYDSEGGLAQLDAILWGALYSEGGYQGSGNATYYGALLMRAAFNASGTPTVYFNECLARGCLEDQLNLQRVTVTSWETD